MELMRRLRTRTSLVLVCIGVVLFASILPAVAPVLAVTLTALWIVIPAIAIVVLRRRAARCDEQPVALLSLLLSRAPPSLALPV
jgi:hypothetical protein